jgi:hypothetical protein
MAHVADVARSIEFYRLLGFETRSSFAPEGKTVWAWLTNGKAHLMVNLGNGPINSGEQAVLFYLYTSNVAAYREELSTLGIKVGPITYPFYMPEGELRVEDPDGYVLLIGQSDEVSL